MEGFHREKHVTKRMFKSNISGKDTFSQGGRGSNQADYLTNVDHEIADWFKFPLIGGLKLQLKCQELKSWWDLAK